MGLYLLLHQEPVLHRLTFQLPGVFIARFIVFWILSFMLTLIFFIFNLKLNFLRLHMADRYYSVKICKLVLGTGVTGFVVLALAYMAFYML
ncbi:hypothetical protein [Pontibacter sp. SGAir0037]|uniref:hypothetical protein n=1 Tax=Pontibacter sp. SGAir0037 TaxID=2571030 RepID=UPI0010F71238|nr:hypothetical protein [Pontibacter sp. SGAir0037]